MSAFQCRQEHILTVAVASMVSRRSEIRNIDRSELSRRLKLLTETNRRSCCERYQSTDFAVDVDDLPPAVGLTRLTLKGDEGEHTITLHETLGDTAQAGMLVNCYEYQACEISGWEDSEAYKLCQDARGNILRMMPGYDQKSWGCYA